MGREAPAWLLAAGTVALSLARASLLLGGAMTMGVALPLGGAVLVGVARSSREARRPYERTGGSDGIGGSCEGGEGRNEG